MLTAESVKNAEPRETFLVGVSSAVANALIRELGHMFL